MILMSWYFCFSSSKNSVDKDYENCIRRTEGVSKRCELSAIHTLHTNLGEQFCRIILKAHLGTGSDYLSKRDTKKSSFNANLEVALKDLGDNFSLDDNQMVTFART